MRIKDNLVIWDERIFLKSLSPEDSEAYRVLRNREENRKWFFKSAEISKEDQEKWFQRYEADDDEFMFSIYEKISGRYLGAAAIYHIDHHNHRAEVGRIIVDSRAAGGKGYGKDAIRCIVDWGAENLGIKTFYAQIYTDNLPSMKSFLGCGFLEKRCGCEEELSRQVLVEKTVGQNGAF